MDGGHIPHNLENGVFSYTIMCQSLNLWKQITYVKKRTDCCFILEYVIRAGIRVNSLRNIFISGA